MLDNSGSMDGSKLETCKRAMLTDIFPNRLHETDRVGLIVFDHSINRRIDLGPWNGSHRSGLESSLRAVRSAGGTQMWNALSETIRMFSASDNSKWLVALTDGASDGRPDEVHRQLRTAAGQAIRVLFITVGLGSGPENLIRRTCMRATGDEMISANGGMAELQKAWQTVGDRLTVSQKIMKQGEQITPAECGQLLRRHMKLDGWSRLKQRHWIRYLFRRCEILASSEKFNKNKDFPHFGSTTMKIMLDEVSSPPWFRPPHT